METPWPITCKQCGSLLGQLCDCQRLRERRNDSATRHPSNTETQGSTDS